MCMVSAVGDRFPSDYWRERHTWIDPTQQGLRRPNSNPSFEEFDKLKKEVEALKKLLQAAIEFDNATGQPHCQKDEKVKIIKKLAKLVGVDIERL